MLLCIFNAKAKMDIDEGKTWVRGKLERSWNKLCREAQEVMQEKYEAALKIL